MGSSPSSIQDPYVFGNIEKDEPKQNKSSPAKLASSKSSNKYQMAADKAREATWIGTHLKVSKSMGFEKDFNSFGVIGTGVLGRVRIVQHKKNNKYFVIKSLKKSQVLKKNMVRHIQREKNILQSLSKSPFIAKCFGTFQDTYKVHFILEYIPGGELFRRLSDMKRFSVSTMKFYAVEILSAIEFIHDMGYIYRDLKPENIMIATDGHIKVVDFGFSRTLGEDENCTTIVGTPEYLAPEQLSGKGKPYTRAVDWWSLACVMFEMYTGKTPFSRRRDDSHFEVYTRVIKGKINWPRNMPEDLKDLLKNLLEVEFDKRLTKVQKIKSHEFFADVDWEVVQKQAYEPPYTPCLSAIGDRTYFDKFPESTDEIEGIDRTQNKDFSGF